MIDPLETNLRLVIGWLGKKKCEKWTYGKVLIKRKRLPVQGLKFTAEGIISNLIFYNTLLTTQFPYNNIQNYQKLELSNMKYRLLHYQN